jgi:hypothetical protein
LSKCGGPNVNTRFYSLLLVVLAVGVAAAQEHSNPAPEKLGTVNFANSCDAAVQPEFRRAVALLHSFQFGAAIQGFQAVLKQDPSCTIAYWGIALSDWSNPMAAYLKPQALLERGRDAIAQARANPPKTARERAYVEAVAQLYDKFETLDQRSRVIAYERAMEKVATSNPQDSEAEIFYALALTAAADPSDKTYAKQLKAGATLERLFAEQPDHPGLAHYIIHTYDVPPLAGRAVNAARRYASIAPDAPHALHMPSHTFTRIGSWQESIDTNILSAAAAKREGQVGEELHASDYQMYAYLQSGQDAAARRLLESLKEIQSRFDPASAATGAAPPIAGIFASAAIPARFALERGAWAEAAKLEVRPSKMPSADAITWFARGIGSARAGDAAGAKRAAEALARLRDQLIAAKDNYWAQQVEIQHRDVTAWTALAAGHAEDALRQMRAAADMEDATEKNAISPGPIAPARELLGEMLMQLKRPAEAQREYEATLVKEPHRFRALHGAAEAAAVAGDTAAAKQHRAELLEVCARGDQPGRPELAAVRRASTSAR